MLALLAQTTDATDAAAGVAATGIFGGIVILYIVLLLLALAFFIWWIILIIDCAKRNEKEFPEKTVWLIVLIVGLIIPAALWLVDILYYFMVVKKYGKAGGAAPKTQ